MRERRLLPQKTAALTLAFGGVAALSFALGSGFLELPAPETGFENVIAESGIVQGGPLTTGASFADYDGDGNLDLLILGSRTKLYRNTGNGVFEDITSSSGIVEHTGAQAGVFGDYDNDGCRDLYLANLSLGPEPSGASDILYRNNCDGTFTDVTQQAGLGKDPYHSRGGAAWGDYDNDGSLDLYVSNFGLPMPDNSYLFEPNVLWRNNGDGTFTDVTKEAGVVGYTSCNEAALEPGGVTLFGGPFKESHQPLWFDYDNDGEADLFVATDSGVSPLYRNDGDGTFTDVTQEAGLCVIGTGMGVDAGDYDNDGDLDLYVTNTGANFFWRNNGDGTFMEAAAETKTADHFSLGWGTGLLDYDNDGDLDLYVANGSIQGELEDTPLIGKVMVDKLYRNLGDGTFEETSLHEGIVGDYAKEPAAFGDYDGNGFPDIFVGSSYLTDQGIHRLYRNKGTDNNWLEVRLEGRESNRDAVGARLRVFAGGKNQIREVTAGSSYISQNSLWQTFGLGKARTVEELEVRWPSGKRTFLSGLQVNRVYDIIEE